MSRTAPEPDPLDRELRQAFRRADLPAAPLALRAEIDALPSSPRTVPGIALRGRFGPWPCSSALLALVATAAVIAVVAAGLPVFLGRPSVGHESPSPSATIPATSSPTILPTLAPTYGPPGKFVPTGSMTVGRDNAMATLLQDGRVLIAGGDAYDLVSKGEPPDGSRTAELYDPTTGSFNRTGSMLEPRGYGSATLLRDGRVLISGGISNGVAYASAELYDPATGTFSQTGSMAAGRHFDSATLLDDGRVLIAGGEIGSSSDGSATAELYDPATGRFSPTGSMTEARLFQTATLLRDGHVLIAGGGIGVSSAELYDPTTGTFSATGSMTITEALTATLLADGRVLVVGVATDDGNIGHNEAQLYDPATGTFSQTGAMIESCNCFDGGTAAPLLADGRVLVPDLSFDGSTPIGSAELYDPVTGTFARTGPMGSYRAGFTDTLLADGRVLFAGDQGPTSAPPAPTLSPQQIVEVNADRSSAELYVP
jgi:Galactose oxidase, central domain